MFSRLLGTETILLESPLPPGECALRLQASVRSRWDIFGVGAIVGRVDAAEFRIRNTGRRNFPLALRGQFAKVSGGTRLVCRLGRNPATFIALVPFSLVVIGMMTTAFANAVPGLDMIIGIAVPLIFVAFMILMGIVEFIRSKDDREIMLDFLRRVMEARPVAGEEPAAVQHRRPR
jgi:hypothetical protein